MYRNTNGKESDDITELGTRGSRMSIIRNEGIRLVLTSRKKCKNLLLPFMAGTGRVAHRKPCCSVEREKHFG